MRVFPAIPLSFFAASALAAPISFNEQIRPILNKNCTACHGGVKQAGEVSFIYRDQALGKSESGATIIVPGDPATSEMIRRITTSDHDDRMPPVKEHPEGLAPEEIELLTEWVKQGAEWQEHWSLVPPRPQALPKVSNPEWPLQPLDHFILARLDAEGLAPTPSSDDPMQWVRRASLDLIGYPLSQQELQRLSGVGVRAKGDDRKALEIFVDDLLASPAFGERWAAMWLDLARYADTQGYEKDGHRDAWAYRDWVIRAFNEDMPYTEFTVKQLAGDLLPESTLDDLVATAFHRNTQTNTEGGTDDEEFRVAAVIDRINTTWTVWQGLTFGCVQCHSHPYDAFRHEEFYKFMAFFNNTEDADLNSDFPTLRVPADPTQHARAVELDHKIRSLRERLNVPGRKLERETEWSELPIESITGPDSVQFTVKGNEVVVEGTVPYKSSFDTTTPGQSLTALRVELRPKSDDPKLLPEHGSVLSQFTAKIIPAEGEPLEIAFTRVFAETLSGPYDPEESLRKGGRGGGAHPKIDRPLWLVFTPAKPVVVPPGAKLQLRFTQAHGGAETKGSVLKRFNLSSSNDPRWTHLVTSPDQATARREWDESRDERKKLGGASVPVMAERPSESQRETRLFIRGNALAKDGVVTAGTPASLPPLLTGIGEAGTANRLAMAEWLVRPDNPLTARVFVNRIWAELFGTGLVETIEDLGTTGTKPSHPELLDFLALRFMNEHEWRLKPLLREIVLSATYMQDHKASAELVERDPQNRLLARGPRTRLTAEMVRDQALHLSGLLTDKIGGPSVMPPQPDGVWSVVYSGAQWKTAEGPDRYRRALYTYWRRTSPYPSFLTFDASSREVCLPRRISTNTPLQALVTLNDPVYLECAQALAKSALKSSEATPESAIRLMHSLLTGQGNSPRTTQILLDLYRDALADYEAHPEEAKHLAETPAQAALVLVANAIMNLDGAMTK